MEEQPQKAAPPAKGEDPNAAPPQSVWRFLDGQGFLLGFGFGNGAVFFFLKLMFYFFGQPTTYAVCRYSVVGAAVDAMYYIVPLFTLVCGGALRFVHRLARR